MCAGRGPGRFPRCAKTLLNEEHPMKMKMARTGLLLGAAIWLLAVAQGAAAPDLRLLDAVQRQDQDAVRTLLKERVDVNARRGDGTTALAYAVHLDDAKTVDLLITA